MTITQTEPENGQFIIVWDYGGELWSNSFYRSDEGYLKEYNSETDEFFVSHFPNKGQEIIGYIQK